MTLAHRLHISPRDAESPYSSRRDAAVDACRKTQGQPSAIFESLLGKEIFHSRRHISDEMSSTANIDNIKMRWRLNYAKWSSKPDLSKWYASQGYGSRVAGY